MRLKYEAKNAWEFERENNKLEDVMNYSKGYMHFLDVGKTERTSAREVVRMAKENGYISIDEAMNNGKVNPGDKIYAVNKDKAVALFIMGKNKLENGMKIIGGHIDSPRIDLKPHPLYQEANLGFFKTHYYGGIKKYQWTTIPLALHGVAALTDGTVVDINIGEDDSDPVFLITDLLPHLSGKQNSKKLSEGIPAENLNIVIGSIPSCEESDIADETKDVSARNTILAILKEKYGINEDDFKSAEIEAVPAAKARSLGLDRSMVAAYGQDDRVCAYPALTALMELGTPEHTALCILSDKEEIGSVGNTGMKSRNFELFLIDLLEKTGIISPYALQRTLSASKALSADVTAAYDPTYSDVMEKNNAAYMGKGISIKKYTGARGKSGASDANAEFIGYVRKIFEDNDVTYQSSEMGKVDEGGGGTIAYILADRGMEVLDCGVPIHSMHSPYESASKYDIYMAYKAYKAFLM